MATKAKPTPDLSEFWEYASPRKPPCKIAFFLAQLADQGREQEIADVQDALAKDPGLLNAGAIDKWFAKRGFATTPTAIANHRRGHCACGRK